MPDKAALNQPNLNNIVFFDGVCGMCNKLVDVLMRMDKNKALLFAPLQGSTASKFLPEELYTELSTFVFYHNGQLYKKSDASIKTLWIVGGIWKTIILTKVLPRFIRDAIYNFVANRRYAWFGQKESCRIPTLEEQSRFLP